MGIWKQDKAEKLYDGWANDEQYALFQKWGFRGCIPGKLDPRANIALETTRKVCMQMIGCTNEAEYEDKLKEWSDKAYNLKQVNIRREKLGLEPLEKSSYHCFKCGNYNNPFDYDNFLSLLNKNICKTCKTKENSLESKEEFIGA